MTSRDEPKWAWAVRVGALLFCLSFWVAVFLIVRHLT